MPLSFVSYATHGKAGSDDGEQIRQSSLRSHVGTETLFLAVLLPFTCCFAIYSARFKTARHGAVFRGMEVRVYPKWVDARFFAPRAKRGRFGAHETQIGVAAIELPLANVSSSGRQPMARGATYSSLRQTRLYRLQAFTGTASFSPSLRGV